MSSWLPSKGMMCKGLTDVGIDETALYCFRSKSGRIVFEVAVDWSETAQSYCEMLRLWVSISTCSSTFCQVDADCLLLVANYVMQHEATIDRRGPASALMLPCSICVQTITIQHDRYESSQLKILDSHRKSAEVSRPTVV